MKEIKLTVKLAMPEADPDGEPKHQSPRICVEDKVRDCLEKIEMNEDSYEEWEFIRRLNNKLMQKKKLGKRAKNLLEMISPTIEKHGPKTSKKVISKSEGHSATRPDGKSLKKSTAYLLGGDE